MRNKKLNSIQWLYRYVFRGIGLVIVLAMVTILWMACQSRHGGDSPETRREMKEILKREHGNASEEISKYNHSRQRQPAPLPKKAN